jgi:hypothetical protein
LRRYLVTEVVTETASGQRHEVRVEREPVSADEVDAVAATPGDAGEPVPGEGSGLTRTSGSALRATHNAEPESRWPPLVQHPPAVRPHPARLDLDAMDCDAPRCRSR